MGGGGGQSGSEALIVTKIFDCFRDRRIVLALLLRLTSSDELSCEHKADDQT